MGLETCLHLRTMSSPTTRALGVPCINYYQWKKLPTLTKVSRKSCDNSSFNLSLHGNYRKLSVVCKARDALNEVQVVTDSSWNELIVGSKNPALVEFWAPWCGPCRMIAPIIDELAKEYGGKIGCYKLNTDDCPSIATQYGIRSIPTVLLFKNGEKKESIIGAVPKSTLTASIEKYVEA